MHGIGKDSVSPPSSWSITHLFCCSVCGDIWLWNMRQTHKEMVHGRFTCTHMPYYCTRKSIVRKSTTEWIRHTCSLPSLIANRPQPNFWSHLLITLKHPWHPSVCRLEAPTKSTKSLVLVGGRIHRFTSGAYLGGLAPGPPLEVNNIFVLIRTVKNMSIFEQIWKCRLHLKCNPESPFPFRFLNTPLH